MAEDETMDEIQEELNETGEIVRTIQNYIQESESAKSRRMDTNKTNFDFYHLKQSWDHKVKGQSKEFLPKQAMAVEQITSYMHQGLIDFGDWFSITPAPGNADPLLTEEEARKLVGLHLDKAGFFTHVSDAIKSGLLGSLMIAKVGGKFVDKPVYFTEKSLNGVALKRKKNQVWQLSIDLIRQEDWFPDPTGEGLYEIQRIEMDLHALKKIAKQRPDMYDYAQIEALEASIAEDKEANAIKARETNQDITDSNYRNRVVLHEMWGTLIDDEGEVIMENCTCTVANDRFLIQKPMPNPFWHGKSPYIVAPILRVPHSVWHKAVMDSPTALNQAMNELYNLMLDSGIMSVFGIKQIRKAWIDNSEDLTDGIAPGTTLEANMSCPPGQKVLERVDTGSLSRESFDMFQLTNAEFQTGSMTNDLRLGNLPQRTTQATEVVEASNSITGTFSGIAKTIEKDYIEPILYLANMNIMQNATDLDSEEIKAFMGETRAKELAAITRQERFERVVNGHDYKVYGLTQTLNRTKDFRKITSLLQTIAASPVLIEEYSKRFDFGKTLMEMVRSLDINVERISLSEDDKLLGQIDQGPEMQEPMPGMPPGMGEGVPQGMTQIPNANAMSGEDVSGAPRQEFAQNTSGVAQ